MNENKIYFLKAWQKIYRKFLHNATGNNLRPFENSFCSRIGRSDESQKIFV